jgi:DNA-binding NarL/FixJ family response regulator
LYPHIRIIILSTASDLTTISSAIKAGADAYILKDEGSGELISALRAINKNEIFLSPSIAHYFSNDTSKLKTRNDYIQFSANLITPREQSVLRLIAEGYTNQQIADTLFISVKTADTHRKNMLAKLKLSNTAALVKFAIENKLI